PIAPLPSSTLFPYTTLFRSHSNRTATSDYKLSATAVRACILRRVSERRDATILPEHDGQRLDRALSLLFPDQSRSSLARLIVSGHVRLNTNEVLKTSHRVLAGDHVEVEIPAPISSG